MNPLDLSPLEIASGVPTGIDRMAPSLPRSIRGTPREHLERAIVPMLERAPACVTFSGGRDSSAVLATAVHVARQTGLPEPIPVTLRFPGVKTTEESAWQEQVVRHLGIKEWERIEIHGELDFLGPIAQGLLRRHGLLWPSNVHTQAPAVRVAAGGTVMTGLEGDGLLGNWRWSGLGDVVARRIPARPRDLARFAYANGPRALRRARMKRGELMPTPWLTTEAERRFAILWMQDEADEPGRWESRIRWWSRRKYLTVIRRSLEIMGADHDAAFGHPLLEPAFLASLARSSPVAGMGNRTRAMDFLFADLLPKEVISRPSKALFVDAFWGEPTREFSLAWDGEGIDPAIVDAEGLKSTWRQESPDTRTAPLLQWIWLMTSRETVQQPVDHE